MAQAALDTLELFDELKKGFSDEQAHLLSKALKRVEEARLDELATKRDLQAALADVDLIKWVVGVAMAQGAFLITVLKLFPAA